MTAPESAPAELRPLLAWLLLRFPDTPKSRARQWIAAGRVRVGGEIVRMPHRTMADPGDTLSLEGRHAPTPDCGAAGWLIHPRVTLLHLDANLAVANKGPGLLSVPAGADDLSVLGILADFLAGDLPARGRGPDGRPRSVPPALRRLQPLPVHRLDQYTSGVFCMAMNAESRRLLIDELQSRAMRREYVAYVEGTPASSQGTWRNWLRLREDGLRQFVIGEAEARQAGETATTAITHYEVIEAFPPARDGSVVSKIRCRLETGCKHQIRAQAAAAGLPLVGDRIYNRAYRGHSAQTPRLEFPRQALHAAMLSLVYPEAGGARMTWAAALPKDLRELETRLRSGRP